MANPGKFNSDQLRMYMNNGVPLSHDQYGRKADEDDQLPEQKSKNLVLPKMLPDVFSMSFYNSMKKKAKYASAHQSARGRQPSAGRKPRPLQKDRRELLLLQRMLESARNSESRTKPSRRKWPSCVLPARRSSRTCRWAPAATRTRRV